MQRGDDLFKAQTATTGSQVFPCHLYPKRREKIDMKNQPKKTLTGDNARFIVTVSIEKRKRIEQVMNDRDKKRTGLTKLSPQELANLNEWLSACS